MDNNNGMVTSENILVLVETLGTELTSKEISTRSKALNHLTESVVKHSVDSLTSREVTTLVEFYCAKLSDSLVLLKSTIRGLQFLVKCTHFPAGGEITVVNTLFREQNVPVLPQADRLAILLLLGELLSSRLAGMLTLGSAFVQNFLQAIDGEGDPRNLVVAFRLFRVVATQFDLIPFTEEMFEVIACYFPIDFKPPNDSVPVTADMLRTELRRCLKCIPSFAPFCLPFLVDKMENAENAVEMEETLTLWLESYDVFDPSEYAKHDHTLWNEVRKSIAMPGSTQCETLAVQCLQKLLRVLLTSEDLEDGLVVLLGQMFADCEPFLCNPEMQLLRPTGDVLLKCCEVDVKICNHLGDRLLHLYMERFQSCSETYRPAYAVVLADLMKVLSTCIVKPQWLTPVLCSGLLALTDTMLVHTNEAMLVSSAFTIAADLMTCLRTDLPATCREHYEKSLRYAMENRAALYAHTAMRHAIRPLVRRVCAYEISLFWSCCSSLIPSTDGDDIPAAWLLSSALNEENFTRIMPCLQRLLFESTDDLTAEQAAEMLRLAVLGHLCEFSHQNVDHFVRQCVAFLQENSTAPAAELVCALCQDLLLEKADYKYVDDIASLFIDSLLSIDRPKDWLSPIFALGTLPMYEQTFDKIRTVLVGYPSRSILARHFRLLALFLNRMPQSSVSSFVNEVVQRLFEADDSSDDVMLLAWVTKALLLRNYLPTGVDCLKRLIFLLADENEDKAQQAARSFSMVLDFRKDRVLNEKYGANVTALYKQRMCSTIVPLLLEGFSTAKRANHGYYFEVLNSLFVVCTEEVVPLDMQKLVPMVMQSLNSDDLTVVVYSLRSLRLIIMENNLPADFERDVQSLVSRLLRLALLEDGSMELRCDALSVLKLIPQHFPVVVLYPVRPEVLRQLKKGGVLDSRKRLVRKEAALALNEWSVLGAV